MADVRLLVRQTNEMLYLRTHMPVDELETIMDCLARLLEICERDGDKFTEEQFEDAVRQVQETLANKKKIVVPVQQYANAQQEVWEFNDDSRWWEMKFSTEMDHAKQTEVCRLPAAVHTTRQTGEGPEDWETVSVVVYGHCEQTDEEICDGIGAQNCRVIRR